MTAGNHGPWRSLALASLGAFVALTAVVAAVGLLPGDLASRDVIVGWLGAEPSFTFFRLVSGAGGWVVMLPAAVLLGVLTRRARQHWWLWAAALLSAALIEVTVKLLVGRPRPDGLSSGFPSGHAAASASFATLVVFSIGRRSLGILGRCTVAGLAALAVLAVGVARIVGGAHWPSDVLGGLLLGVGCAAVAIWQETARAGSRSPAMPRARAQPGS